MGLSPSVVRAVIANFPTAKNLPKLRGSCTLDHVGRFTGGTSMSFDRGAAGSERWFPLMDRPRWKRRLFDRTGQGRSGAARALGSGTPRAADLARPAAP